MNRALHLATVRRVTAARGRIVRAVNLGHVAGVVFHHVGASDEIRIAQPHLTTRREPVKLLGRVLHEVITIDVELARERQLARTRERHIVRIIRRVQFVDFALGVIRDDHLHRIHHAQHARHDHVEIVANGMFEHADLHPLPVARHTRCIGKGANGIGTHATATHTGDRGHARIIPPVHMSIVHQAQQLPLAEHRVVDLQSRKLDLRGWIHIPGLLHQPVVNIATVLELERAQRARDAFDSVAQPMSKVVQRVDAPVVATPIVMRMTNAQQQRIAHDHVGMREIDLCTQHVCPIRELTRAHAAQQIEVFGHRTRAVGTRRTRRGDGAAPFANLLLRLRIDVRLVVGHQAFGDLVELLEIVRRVVFRVPLKAQPLHVALDRLHVLHIFRGGIGVVKTQIAGAAVLLRDAEVQADRFGVTHVQEPVGLRRKTRSRRATKPTSDEVIGNQLANEVAAWRVRRVGRSGVSHGRR